MALEYISPRHAARWFSLCRSAGLVSQYTYRPAYQRDRASLRHRKAGYSSTASLEALAAESTKSHDDHVVPLSGPLDLPLQPGTKGIRDHLRAWQAQLSARASGTLPETAQFGTERLPDHVAYPGTDLEDSKEEDLQDIIPLTDLMDNDLLDTEEDRPYLKRGDLVELSGIGLTGGPELAIFIRELESKSQFYTMRGRWIHRGTKRIYFRKSKFIPRRMVEPILPYLPSGEDAQNASNAITEDSVPRAVGGLLIKKMLEFWNDAEETFRKYSTALDQVHEKMAHESKLRYMSLLNITQEVLNTRNHKQHPPLAPAQYAVHRALSQKTVLFAVDSIRQLSGMRLEIRPKSYVHLIHKVESWARESLEEQPSKAAVILDDDLVALADDKAARPIKDFVLVARRLIRQSRQTRVATKGGSIGPYSGSPESSENSQTGSHGTRSTKRLSKFSEDNAAIIRFLEYWTETSLFQEDSSVNSTGSFILRAIGMYEGYELNPETGFLCLQEMGVLTPWANRLMYNHRLDLHDHFKPLAPIAATGRSSAPDQESCATQNDSMAALRRDWKNMEVYCIDDLDASEIDDGVSLERIPGETAKYWVHVHCANPSAFIDPGHHVAKQAEHRIETVYLTERRFPMLPNAESQLRYSLAPDRPSLTFSTLLGLDGTVLDTNITPGIVRNVIAITPDALDRHFQPNHTEEKVRISVGSFVPQRSGQDPGKQPELSAAQVQDLRLLRRLADAYLHVRESRGAISFSLPHPSLTVHEGLEASVFCSPARSAPHFVDSDPAIQLTATPFRPEASQTGSGSPTRSMVQSLMILAGEGASRWCHEREIPIPFRGTLMRPENQDAMAAVRERLLRPQSDAEYYPLLGALEYMRLAGRFLWTTTPLPHQMLGIESYTKVTSPLRRFGDLLCHWQVEAALRWEAQRGHSLAGQTGRDFLPFSLARVGEISRRMTDMGSLIRTASSQTTQFWVTQLMMRAHKFGEAQLPETHEMFVYNTRGTTTSGKAYGYLKTLCISVQMLVPKWAQDAGVETGDCFEVRIAEVNTYQRVILVEPVRVISKICV